MYLIYIYEAVDQLYSQGRKNRVCRVGNLSFDSPPPKKTQFLLNFLKENIHNISFLREKKKQSKNC